MNMIIVATVSEGLNQLRIKLDLRLAKIAKATSKKPIYPGEVIYPFIAKLIIDFTITTISRISLPILHFFSFAMINLLISI